jgi:predicted nucleic acid-binding protein
MPGSSEAQAAIKRAAASSTATKSNCFIDTNIWVYAHRKKDGEARHARALALLQSGTVFVISPQVVAEYYSVMLRNKQTDTWIQANLRAMFARTRLQPANAAVLSTALELRTRYGFSFWDCQVAASSIEAQCSTLWTEDMQHGQVLSKVLKVVNPLLG